MPDYVGFILSPVWIILCSNCFRLQPKFEDTVHGVFLQWDKCGSLEEHFTRGNIIKTFWQCVGILQDYCLEWKKKKVLECETTEEKRLEYEIRTLRRSD